MLFITENKSESVYVDNICLKAGLSIDYRDTAVQTCQQKQQIKLTKIVALIALIIRKKLP